MMGTKTEGADGEWEGVRECCNLVLRAFWRGGDKGPGNEVENVVTSSPLKSMASGEFNHIEMVLPQLRRVLQSSFAVGSHNFYLCAPLQEHTQHVRESGDEQSLKVNCISRMAVKLLGRRTGARQSCEAVRGEGWWLNGQRGGRGWEQPRSKGLLGAPAERPWDGGWGWVWVLRPPPPRQLLLYPRPTSRFLWFLRKRKKL